MKVVAIIPARMSASRFPGKPLAPILGLPMVEHVRRRALLSTAIDDVIVATCDEEIRDTVSAHGGRAVMTSDKHVRCTDRIAEAARSVKADVIINVQGDEPLLNPQMLSDVAEPFETLSDLEVVNLVSVIDEEKEFLDMNAPKVVTDREGYVIYISRQPIPWVFGRELDPPYGLKQLGIIAFRGDFLQEFCELPPTPMEKAESIDMLRALEHGRRILAVRVAGKMIGVDRPEDIERVEREMRRDPLVAAYASDVGAADMRGDVR